MRLVEFGVFPTESEMVMWQANCDTITQQLELRFGKSAEDLIKDQVLVEILNTVVERMPRNSDIFRTAAINSNQSFINSKTTILNAILKICQNLTKSMWKNTGLFDKTFFLEIVTLYPSNEKDIGQGFEKFFNRKLISKEDIVKYLDVSAKECLDELIEFGKDLKNSYEADRNNRNSMNIVEYLVTIGSLVVDFKNVSKFVELHKIKVDNKWIYRIPDLFEFIYSNFDYPTLFEIASNIDGFPLRKVFESRTFALQRLVESYDSKIPQQSKLFTAYLSAMGVSDLKTENDLFSEARKITVERMRKCGYFEDLGNSNDEEIQSQIGYVSEMWPNLTPQYIHLILRHFSYNAELAVSNLCSNELIPLEFKFLEANEDWSSPSDCSEWPPLDFTASDEIERALYADIKRKEAEAAEASKKPGLFSLAHSSSASRIVAPPTAEQEMSEVRRKAEEYKANVFAKLNKIRAPPPPPEDGEDVLVPMGTSKIYSALNNLKLTTPEMVAIRPTYDKYKYEIPNDDGMYDDEYDDEHEARVFNIERLNEELESSSEEEEVEDTAGKQQTPPQPTTSSASRGNRGGRGNKRGRGQEAGPPTGLTKGRGQETRPAQGPARERNQEDAGGPPPGLAQGGRGAARGNPDNNYTGGRNRQLKERHKSDQKQRGADRKHRGVGY